jgi:hypothetical protein
MDDGPNTLGSKLSILRQGGGNIDPACHQPPTKPQGPFGAQVTFTVSGTNLIVEAPGNKKGNFSSAPLCKAMFDIYLVLPLNPKPYTLCKAMFDIYLVLPQPLSP